MISKRNWFVRFAQEVSRFTGRPMTFLVAAGAVVVWAVLGPVFDYSDTWQLVINTSTTIITFLMVFVIQNTQNRDTAAMHIKLDELIRVSADARNIMLDLEELDDKDLEMIRRDYEHLAQEDGKRFRQEKTDAEAKCPPGGRRRSRSPAASESGTKKS